MSKKPPATKAAPHKNNKVAADKADPQDYVLRLYVAGQTLKSLTAIANLKKICGKNLVGRCQTEVIDLMINPQLAHEDEIVALPTLVRKKPLPEHRIIGDLSDTEGVLIGLGLREHT